MSLLEPNRLRGFFETKTYAGNKISNLSFDDFSKLHLGLIVNEKTNGIIPPISTYRLGWGSILSAKISGDKIIVNSVQHLNDKKKEVNFSVDQLVTRAVSSCTVLIARSGDSLWFAHLDKSDISNWVTLNDYFKDLNSDCRNELFISRINQIEEKNFFQTIMTKFHNPFCTELIRDLRITSEHPDKFSPDFNPIVMHNEIGVFMDSENKPQIFGDLSYLVDDRRKKTKDYIAVPFLYAGNAMNKMKELLSIYENLP